MRRLFAAILSISISACSPALVNLPACPAAPAVHPRLAPITLAQCPAGASAGMRCFDDAGWHELMGEIAELRREAGRQ